MCQNAFFPCLQGIGMLRSKSEEQKIDVWPDKKKYSIQSSEKNQMQEYTEFRKKESKILRNFKLMDQQEKNEEKEI